MLRRFLLIALPMTAATVLAFALLVGVATVRPCAVGLSLFGLLLVMALAWHETQ